MSNQLKSNMNNSRRKVLYSVLDSLMRLTGKGMTKKKAGDILGESQQKVEQCMDEEEMCLDNLPEALRWSSLYDRLSDNCNDLSVASSDLEMANDTCQASQSYNYEDIRKDVAEAVHAINDAVTR